jgi:hypothetical protein
MRHFKIVKGGEDSDLVPDECFEHQNVVCLREGDDGICDLYYVTGQDEKNNSQDVEWFEIPEIPEGAMPISTSAFERMTGGI